nr:hypothetical protein [Kibdelosporangium sp. MJ126-NF4]
MCGGRGLRATTILRTGAVAVSDDHIGSRGHAVYGRRPER